MSSINFATDFVVVVVVVVIVVVVVVVVVVVIVVVRRRRSLLLLLVIALRSRVSLQWHCFLSVWKDSDVTSRDEHGECAANQKKAVERRQLLRIEIYLLTTWWIRRSTMASLKCAFHNVEL